MNSQVKPTDTVKLRVQRLSDPSQPVYTGEQRLTAMQDHVDLLQSVRLGMCSNPLRDQTGSFHGHDHWTAMPALIMAEVDITVITGKITAAVYLQHELLKGHHRLAHTRTPGRSDGRVKRRHRHRSLESGLVRKDPLQCVSDNIAGLWQLRQRNRPQICEI